MCLTYIEILFRYSGDFLYQEIAILTILFAIPVAIVAPLVKETNL